MERQEATRAPAARIAPPVAPITPDPVPIESEPPARFPQVTQPFEQVVDSEPPPPEITVGRALVTGVQNAGRPVYRLLEVFGDHLILLVRALAWATRRPFRPQNYLDAAVTIGYSSLPIVLLVGVCTGMVMSLQLVHAFGVFGLTSVAGGATGKAIALELGPVLTALVLAGRAGSGMASEIGQMRISEQISALESMAVNPVQFLVTPRLIAAMIVTPILTLLFFVVSMAGAYFVAVFVTQVDAGSWSENLRDIVPVRDVAHGVIKGGFFGLMIALVGCYQGMNASGGGRGVGIGTTRAFVIASAATLVMDYGLSDVLLKLLPAVRNGI